MGNLKQMEQALGFDILSIFCYNNSKKIKSKKQNLAETKKQTNKGKNGLEQGRFFRNLPRPHPAAEIYFTCGPFGWRRIDCSGRFVAITKRRRRRGFR